MKVGLKSIISFPSNHMHQDCPKTIHILFMYCLLIIVDISSPIFLFAIGINNYLWIVLSKTVVRYYMKKKRVTCNGSILILVGKRILPVFITDSLWHESFITFFSIFCLPNSYAHLSFSMFSGFIAPYYFLFL